jgi:hypothetical protein
MIMTMTVMLDSQEALIEFAFGELLVLALVSPQRLVQVRILDIHHSGEEEWKVV